MRGVHRRQVGLRSFCRCYRREPTPIDIERAARWYCCTATDGRIRRQQTVRRDDDAAPTRRNGSDADSESVDDVIEGCCSDWQEDVHPHCVAPRSAPPPFIIHRRKGADDGEPVDRVCSHTISSSSSSSSGGSGAGLTRVPDNRLQTGVSLTLAGDKSTTLYARITGDVTCTSTSLTWLTGAARHVTDRPTDPFPQSVNEWWNYSWQTLLLLFLPSVGVPEGD